MNFEKRQNFIRCHAPYFGFAPPKKRYADIKQAGKVYYSLPAVAFFFDVLFVVLALFVLFGRFWRSVVAHRKGFEDRRFHVGEIARMNELAHLFFGKRFFVVLCTLVQKHGQKPAKIFNAVLSGKRFIKAIEAAEFILHFVDHVQTEKKVSFLVKRDREASVFNCTHSRIRREAFSDFPPFLLSIFD